MLMKNVNVTTVLVVVLVAILLLAVLNPSEGGDVMQSVLLAVIGVTAGFFIMKTAIKIGTKN